MLNIALVFTIALTGLLFGFLLARIAPEELVSGRKYFVLLQRLIAGIMVVVVAYSLIQEAAFLLLGLWSVAAVAMLVLDSFFSKSWMRVGFYVAFALPYIATSYITPSISTSFAASPSAFQLLLASLLFVYGLPVGTLLVQERSTVKKNTAGFP